MGKLIVDPHTHKLITWYECDNHDGKNKSDNRYSYGGGIYPGAGVVYSFKKDYYVYKDPTFPGSGAPLFSFADEAGRQSVATWPGEIGTQSSTSAATGPPNSSPQWSNLYSGDSEYQSRIVTTDECKTLDVSNISLMPDAHTSNAPYLQITTGPNAAQQSHGHFRYVAGNIDRIDLYILSLPTTSRDHISGFNYWANTSVQGAPFSFNKPMYIGMCPEYIRFPFYTGNNVACSYHFPYDQTTQNYPLYCLIVFEAASGNTAVQNGRSIISPDGIVFKSCRLYASNYIEGSYSSGSYWRTINGYGYGWHPYASSTSNSELRIDTTESGWSQGTY